MMGHLIVLDNWDRASPVGKRDMDHHLITDSMIEVGGEDSSHTCGKYQVCRGLAARIEGGIHNI